MAQRRRERESRRGREKKKRKAAQGDELTAAFHIWQQPGAKVCGWRSITSGRRAAAVETSVREATDVFTSRRRVGVPSSRAAPRSPAASGWRPPSPPLAHTLPETSSG